LFDPVVADDALAERRQGEGRADERQQVAS
jgi:hypothetical protein